MQFAQSNVLLLDKQTEFIYEAHLQCPVRPQVFANEQSRGILDVSQRSLRILGA